MKINLKNIQTEVDAAYLYQILSAHEEDPVVADIFKQMSEIEMSHAQTFLNSLPNKNHTMPKPSCRAKVIHAIGKIFGYDVILGFMLDTEKSISNSILSFRKNNAQNSSFTDTSHVKILKELIDTSKVSGTTFARFEKKHRTVGGNAIRAAVLGGNDGLVSNFSLVMGIAGATGGQKEVLLTGIAGLLAGALSMALGEWISVRSSQELYENQMQLEMDELEQNPEAEKKELILIYRAKGIPQEQAESIAQNVIENKEQAHQVLVKEELGINSEDVKGSAMEAAITSFLLFAVGAIIPVLPFMFSSGYTAILLSLLFSAIGLFAIGAAITLFTARNVWFSGFRQVAFGIAAAAITFSIGKIIGVSING